MSEAPDMTSADPGADRGAFSWVAVGFIAFVGLLVIAVPVVFGAVMEQRREDRIDNAETKYDAAYLRAAKDGEGGGMWRLADSSVTTCRISGDTDDPVLRCGAENEELPEAGCPDWPVCPPLPGQGRDSDTGN